MKTNINMLSSIEIYNILGLMNPQEYAIDRLKYAYSTHQALRQSGRTTSQLVDVISYMTAHPNNKVLYVAHDHAASLYIRDTFYKMLQKIHKYVWFDHRNVIFTSRSNSERAHIAQTINLYVCDHAVYEIEQMQHAK